jgi:hypothetical protein
MSVSDGARQPHPVMNSSRSKAGNGGPHITIGIRDATGLVATLRLFLTGKPPPIARPVVCVDIEDSAACPRPAFHKCKCASWSCYRIQIGRRLAKGAVSRR